MLQAEEFLCGAGAPHIRPPAPLQWMRPAAQWFGIGLAHVVAIGMAFQASQPVRQIKPVTIQASLVLPQVPEQPQAKLPEQPKPQKFPQTRPQPRPAPLLAAAPRDESPPSSSFAVAEPLATPAPAAPAAPVSAAATPAPLTPPVFNADYLENPPPPYPQQSRKRGQTGRVLLHVFVSADGRAERVDIHTSSGFELLDFAARNAVAGWRFVPARRGNERVAAWVLVPISFVM